MKITKKIDSVGRIAIPRDIRRSLRWMDGDEIEIISNDDNTLLLKKHEDNSIRILEALREEWLIDPKVKQMFDELITTIESKNNK